MANNCNTTYKIIGNKTALEKLNSVLDQLFATHPIYDVRLRWLAERFGIDADAEHIHVRGTIITHEWYENKESNYQELTICTDTAWVGCHELFSAINSKLNNALSISYIEMEVGMAVFRIHDEWDFFREECVVYADGMPFDWQWEELFDTVDDAIDFWYDRIGLHKNKKLSQKEHLNLIHDYPYEDEDVYFHIYRFERV